MHIFTTTSFRREKEDEETGIIIHWPANWTALKCAGGGGKKSSLFSQGGKGRRRPVRRIEEGGEKKASAKPPLLVLAKSRTTHFRPIGKKWTTTEDFCSLRPFVREIVLCKKASVCRARKGKTYPFANTPLPTSAPKKGWVREGEGRDWEWKARHESPSSPSSSSSSSPSVAPSRHYQGSGLHRRKGPISPSSGEGERRRKAEEGLQGLFYVLGLSLHHQQAGAAEEED